MRSNWDTGTSDSILKSAPRCSNGRVNINQSILIVSRNSKRSRGEPNPPPTPAPTPLSSCPSAFTSQDLFKLNACNAIASSSHISIYVPPPPPPPLPSMSYYQSYPSTPPLTDSSTPFSSPSLSPCPTPPLTSPPPQEAKPAVPIGCRYSSDLSVKSHRQLPQFAFHGASFTLKPATFSASNARGMDVVSESSCFSQRGLVLSRRHALFRR